MAAHDDRSNDGCPSMQLAGLVDMSYTNTGGDAVSTTVCPESELKYQLPTPEQLTVRWPANRPIQPRISKIWPRIPQHLRIEELTHSATRETLRKDGARRPESYPIQWRKNALVGLGNSRIRRKTTLDSNRELMCGMSSRK